MTTMTAVEWVRAHFLYMPDGHLVWIAHRYKRLIGTVADTKTYEGYRRVNVMGRSVAAHRVVWVLLRGEEPEVVDHINGDKQDNRIENLRSVSRLANNQNKRKASRASKSGVLGAFAAKRGVGFISRVCADGKRHELGWFPTAQEAHEAYVMAKRALHPWSTL
jgi:hypothetical protein